MMNPGSVDVLGLSSTHPDLGDPATVGRFFFPLEIFGIYDQQSQSWSVETTLKRIILCWSVVQHRSKRAYLGPRRTVRCRHSNGADASVSFTNASGWFVLAVEAEPKVTTMQKPKNILWCFHTSQHIWQNICFHVFWIIKLMQMKINSRVAALKSDPSYVNI